MQPRFLIVILGIAPLMPAEDRGASSVEFVEKARTEIPALQAARFPPVWTAHALLLAEHSESAAPVFRAFDRTGGRMAEFTLAIPDATLITVLSHRFALGPDGSLAVGGSAYTRDQKGAAFVAWLSADGRPRALTRLSPLAAPDAVTMAADGMIWVASPGPVGREDPREDYPVILRFDRSGALLGTVLRRSELKARSRLLAPCFFVASPDRVGWYSKGARAYLEFSLEGRLLDRFESAEESGERRVNAVALCGDGSLYAGVQVHDAGGAAAGWGIYRFDRRLRVWKFTAMPGKGVLLGCEGDQLAAATGPSTVSWFERRGN
jgi:hypothetical protein